jgi:hypothetical protein
MDPSVQGEHPSATALLPDSTQKAIRAELHRLLASPRFSSSQRCQSLLRYVVENALDGKTDSLKERCIGIDVFGRDLTYDLSSDPVVRLAAGEVRKRLAQYYYDPANQSEIRIELLVGSYVPVFPSVKGTHTAENENTPVSAERGDAVPEKPQGTSPTGSRFTLRKRRALGVLAATLVFAVASTWLYRHFQPRTSDTFASFWAPIITSPDPALICIGEMQLPRLTSPSNAAHGSSARIDSLDSSDTQHGYPVAPPLDTITVVNLAILLHTEHKAFSIRGEGSTSFGDLQKGPVILLGAFNNDWTLRLTQTMRFHFAFDPKASKRWIVDEQEPGAQIGAVETKDQISESDTEGYALIARTFDSHTEQATILIAGLTPAATHAGGEFLSNPAYLNTFGKTAPQNWQTKNMELVIVSTNVNGDSGPPRVVASYFW